MESDKVQCSNCKCWRIPGDYIGKTGRIVKTCVKCRDKDARTKKRPEVIEKHNQRQRERNYSAISRAKKRAENEEAYLAHNAEIMRKWVAKNKERLTAWRTANVKSRLGGIRQQADRKGYAWELGEECATSLMMSPCFYCGFLSGDTLNGIDRMDNRQGYSAGNCVGCCKTCNFMKKSLDAHTFVERCGQVSARHGGPGAPCDSWRDVISGTFSEYKHRADKKSLAFELTDLLFHQLTGSECAYCGRPSTMTHKNGIDRVDNAIGYTTANCVSCCGECNHSKRDIHADAFIQQCKQIAAHDHDIPGMPRCLAVISKRM